MVTLLWCDRPRYSGQYLPSGTIMTLPPRDAYRVTVREAAPGQWEWEILREIVPWKLDCARACSPPDEPQPRPEQRRFVSSSSSWTLKLFGSGPRFLGACPKR
jgi:hypothetical protein